MSDATHCYVGRMPGCRCLGVVVVDSKEHMKDTSKTVANAVKNGLEVERMTIEDFRNSKDSFGCAHELRMRECKKRGLNQPRQDK